MRNASCGGDPGTKGPADRYCFRGSRRNTPWLNVVATLATGPFARTPAASLPATAPTKSPGRDDTRRPDPKGDRVKFSMTGRFLSFKRC